MEAKLGLRARVARSKAAAHTSLRAAVVSGVAAFAIALAFGTAFADDGHGHDEDSTAATQASDGHAPAVTTLAIPIPDPRKGLAIISIILGTMAVPCNGIGLLLFLTAPAA